MFKGKKIKELENRILLLESELQRERQNNEIKRLDHILEFFKGQTNTAKNTHIPDTLDYSLEELAITKKEDPEIDEILISKEYANKIDDLHNIDFATSEDLRRLYNNISDLVHKDLKPSIEETPKKMLSILLTHFDKTLNDGK